MFQFHGYPLPTDDSAFARSALPTAPVRAERVAPRPKVPARLLAQLLRASARAQLTLARRVDPQPHGWTPRTQESPNFA